MEEWTLRPIARIQSDFSEKFGIPRQSGLVEALQARVVFAPEYRVREAFRGLEGFTHIWLVWGFSQNVEAGWSPTVRPPRLGGNVRMGVFATRSPFRPNPIGLSCVELLAIDYDAPDGPALVVGGADLLNGTPIFDVKPYVPHSDCRPQARGGFADAHREDRLAVDFPPAAGGPGAPGQAGGPAGRAGRRPQALLPARPPAPVRPGLRRAAGALYRGGRRPPRAPGGKRLRRAHPPGDRGWAFFMEKSPPRKSGKVFGGGGLQWLEGGNWVLDQKTALRFVH